jgi:toxin ParE1/3/4
MGLKVRWSRQSEKQLIAIRAYVTEHSPSAAERVRLQIIKTVRLLGELPQLGRVGRKEGTREFVVPHFPYLIIYRIEGDGELVVLAIFHGAQER